MKELIDAYNAFVLKHPKLKEEAYGLLSLAQMEIEDGEPFDNEEYLFLSSLKDLITENN